MDEYDTDFHIWRLRGVSSPHRVDCIVANDLAKCTDLLPWPIGYPFLTQTIQGHCLTLTNPLCLNQLRVWGGGFQGEPRPHHRGTGYAKWLYRYVSVNYKFQRKNAQTLLGMLFIWFIAAMAASACVHVTALFLLWHDLQDPFSPSKQHSKLWILFSISHWSFEAPKMYIRDIPPSEHQPRYQLWFVAIRLIFSLDVLDFYLPTF